MKGVTNLKNYYEILNVENTATKTEIQKTYRVLARKYHPDVNSGNPKFGKIFANINEAYEVLKDEERRKEYDKKLFSTKENLPKSNKKQTPEKPFDVSDLGSSFESFFGFNAKTGNITNEEKIKNKNPLDTGALFEKFMGFKK